MTTAEVVPISVKLEPIFCYGVKPNVFGGIHFTRENYLLYVNGCGISLYSGNDKKQELVPLADKGKHLTAIGRLKKDIYIMMITRDIYILFVWPLRFMVQLIFRCE